MTRFLMGILSLFFVFFAIHTFVPPLRPAIRALGREVWKLLRWAVRSLTRLVFRLTWWLFRQLCGLIGRGVLAGFRRLSDGNP
jgi:hypothetical protein